MKEEQRGLFDIDVNGLEHFENTVKNGEEIQKTPEENILFILQNEVVQIIMQGRGLFSEKSCAKCACPFYWKIGETIYCLRCWPPKGYHKFADLIDQLWPRLRRF